MTGLAGHTHHLPYIFVQAKSVKDLRKEVKHPLESWNLHGCKKAIIRIKVGFHPLYVPPKHIWSSLPPPPPLPLIPSDRGLFTQKR